MLKVTILLAIFSIVSFAVTRCLGETMSKMERIQAVMYDELPTRCFIAFWVTALLSLATVVCLIITIIAW